MTAVFPPLKTLIKAVLRQGVWENVILLKIPTRAVLWQRRRRIKAFWWLIYGIPFVSIAEE
jgi:hypothetical protein